MTRGKLSTRAMLLAGGIGLSAVLFSGLPATAQVYTCPDGTTSSTIYSCDYNAYGYGYPYYYGGYGWDRGGHGWGHGMGHVAHFGGGGFAHAGGFGGGFHSGGGGHR